MLGLRPAPIDDDTTPTWTLGSPPGSASRTCMNTGKFAVSLFCSGVIDEESSTMKRMSRLRFTACWMMAFSSRLGHGVGCSSRFVLHAQSAESEPASANQRARRTFDEARDETCVEVM